MWFIYLAIILVFVVLVAVLISVINRSYRMRELLFEREDLISEYDEVIQSYGNVFQNLENYINHLNRVKLTEHYYGDVEVQSLHEHTQFIMGQMSDVDKHYHNFSEKKDSDNVNAEQTSVIPQTIKSDRPINKKPKRKKERNSEIHKKASRKD